MITLARFFTPYDLILVPVCFFVLFGIIRYRASLQRDPVLKKLYQKAFFVKVPFVIIYTLIVEFYFKGGDTSLYYQGVKDLRAALADDFDMFPVIVRTLGLSPESPLFPYFFYDNYDQDLTYYYMVSSSNFFIPKLGLIPSLFFFNSYLCINLCFGLFVLGGSLRLFKTFYHYYPAYWREMAFATLFLPSVVFWSSGLLKDTICFGAIGFIVYGVLNIFIRKRKIFSSLVFVLASAFLLYYIKVYILLALVLALVIWLFAETNKVIKDATLRRVFGMLTFLVAILMGYLMINYFTSQEAAKVYSLDALLERSEYQRRVYANLATENEGSFYTINASNPVNLVFNSIVATFFRPFIWEISSPMVLLSAVEAFGFFYLTLNFMVKRGVGKFFKIPFSEPRLLMCFLFAMTFAVAVGSSTANFGALSRYKIPCIPFYLVMIFLLYRKTDLPFPKWMNRILGYKRIQNQKTYVRTGRVGQPET